MPRQTPHRATRDVRKEKSVQEEIRSENQRLRRENARLRRELERRSSSVSDVEEQPLRRSAKPKVDVDSCPACQSTNTETMKVGPSNFRYCRECRWRQKINS